MLIKFNHALDHLSDFLAHRKGLLPLVGILLILVNFAFQLVPVGWLTTTNFFLHLGLVVAILGILIAWAL